MLVLTTSTSVTIARKKTIKNTKDGKNLGTTTKTGKDSENLRFNLAQIPCI